MARQPNTNKNADAVNRTYSFRLDRTDDNEREARKVLDGWIVEALDKGKTLRDIVAALVLKHAGYPLQEADNQAIVNQIAFLQTTIENQGERLSSEINDTTQTIMRVLSQLRSNPGAFQEYVERADGDDDELDASFIGNLLDNLGR